VFEGSWPLRKLSAWTGPSGGLCPYLKGFCRSQQKKNKIEESKAFVSGCFSSPKGSNFSVSYDSCRFSLFLWRVVIDFWRLKHRFIGFSLFFFILKTAHRLIFCVFLILFGSRLSVFIFLVGFHWFFGDFMRNREYRSCEWHKWDGQDRTKGEKIEAQDK
jgi:hypothetical protein